MGDWILYAVLTAVSIVVAWVLGRRHPTVVEDNSATVDAQKEDLEEVRVKHKQTRDELEEAVEDANQQAEQTHASDPDDIDLGNRYSSLLERLRAKYAERSGED